MPKRPRCNRRASSQACHPSPHVAPNLHPGGRHGGLRMSALREQLGGHGTERGAPGKTGEASPPDHGLWVHDVHVFVSFCFHSYQYPFMILLPGFRLVRSCVHGFLPFASFLMKFPFCQVYSFGIVLLELLTASPPATKREATCHWVKVVDDLRNRHVRLLTCSAVQQCLEQLLSF